MKSGKTKTLYLFHIVLLSHPSEQKRISSSVTMSDNAHSFSKYKMGSVTTVMTITTLVKYKPRKKDRSLSEKPRKNPCAISEWQYTFSF